MKILKLSFISSALAEKIKKTNKTLIKNFFKIMVINYFFLIKKVFAIIAPPIKNINIGNNHNI